MWLFLALFAAASWGTADFLGGLAAKLTPALRVLLIGLPAGLAVLLPFVVASGDQAGASLLAWGAASGLASGLGTALLYWALGAGPMNVVAPLSATSSALIPIAVGLLGGEQPGSAAVIGMALAAFAVILISRERPAEPVAGASRKTVLISFAAGALLGTAVALMDRVAHEGSLWPVAASRASAWTVVLGVALATGVAGLPTRRAVPFAITAGVLDTAANAASLRALDDGLLSVVAVIIALYPGTTVVLARVFLKERLNPAQVAGLVLAGVAIALMALG